MGLLKFLFFVIIIYYSLKLIGRYIMPYLISIFIKKAQDRMMGNPSDNMRQKKSKKEGEVSIDSVPRKSSKTNKENLGDYVDYEEVED